MDGWGGGGGKHEYVGNICHWLGVILYYGMASEVQHHVDCADYFLEGIVLHNVGPPPAGACTPW